MKLLSNQFGSLLTVVITSCFCLGCASRLSNYSIIEIADEAQVQGCKKIGAIAGRSHWGGLTGQDVSLEVAKKRALRVARAKGATHVLWSQLDKGFLGARVAGSVYFCQSSSNSTSENAGKPTEVVTLSRSVTPQKGQSPSHVAVMRFESVSVDSGVSIVVTDIFTNQIQAKGKYRVMERSQMTKVLQEQGFQNSGACNSTECAVEIGKLLSIDKMFIGSVGKLGESWFLTIRLIDVRTGEILSNLSKKVIGKVDDLSSAALQMANEFSQ